MSELWPVFPEAVVPSPICVGISACLLGEAVRYDGGHKENTLLSEYLADHLRFLPVCPEIGCGLGVPRTPMRLEGSPQQPHLRTVPSAAMPSPMLDHTRRLSAWSQQKIEALRTEKFLAGFLFKSRSPSCGLAQVDLFSERGSDTCGQAEPVAVGIFARMFCAAFPGLPVAEGDLLQDSRAVQTFLEAVKQHICETSHAEHNY